MQRTFGVEKRKYGIKEGFCMVTLGASFKVHSVTLNLGISSVYIPAQSYNWQTWLVNGAFRMHIGI
jgi:hypothetical protein